MALSFNTRLKHVAAAYATLLHVPITSTDIKEKMEQSPYYPSLLSLSEVFDYYNIENGSYEIPPEHFDRLPPPFVALIRTPQNGKDFVLVTEIGPDKVLYHYDNKKPQSVPKGEFLSGYKNIIWVAEPNENSGDAHYVKNKEKEKAARKKRRLLIVGSALLLFWFFVINFSLSSTGAFIVAVLLKLTGSLIGMLLLLYQIDKGNVFIRQICSSGGQVNCDAVLNSKASKIGDLSWGEIGFFYFSATSLWLFIPGLSFLTKASWLAIANACAIPYIPFSIYYQWKVVKQWCVICLGTQLVLLLEFIWSIDQYWRAPFIPVHDPVTIVNIFFCILLPVIAWYGLKNFFIKVRDHDLYANAYKRLQYNPDLFNTLLLQQPKAPDGWQCLGIDIGDPAAKNFIIKVCNPYCGPCAEAHRHLKQLMETKSDLRVKIIFSTKNEERDRGLQPVSHLLAIAATGDIGLIQRALDSWYAKGKANYALFASTYLMNGELQQQSAKIDAMSAWCTEAEVTYTPTIFVNGYQIPENYSLEELRYIL